MSEKKRPLIGISACLLGSPIRYNKGHTTDRWVTRELDHFVDFYPVCPEMEMGLGTPREEIHLYYDRPHPSDLDLHLRSKYTKQELTELAHTTYQAMNRQMEQNQLDGFILMRKSPSCGLENVKTVSADEQGIVLHKQGLYASNLQKYFPLLPKIDSGRLKNFVLREHFIKNVYASFRFHQLEKKVSVLQDFHKRYKYILMEHSQLALKELGRIVANHQEKNIDDLFAEYKEKFFTTLQIKASNENRFNVFLHIMGYLKKFLNSQEKQEILNLCEDFKQGLQNYLVPLKLLEFLIKKYDVTYLQDHYYFNPYPKELKLFKEI